MALQVFSISGTSLWGDTIITIYNHSSHQLGVLTNTMNVFDQKQLNYAIKDRFTDLERIAFFSPRATKSYQPADEIRDVVNNSENLILGWNCQDLFMMLENLDDLAAPYTLRMAREQHKRASFHQNWIDLQSGNEKAARVVGRKRIYPTLQQQAALAGLPIVNPIEPIFEDRLLTPVSIARTIEYHASRAIMIGKLFTRPEYRETILTKWLLIKQYHLTQSATDSSANLATAVITNAGKQRFVDYPTVKLDLQRNGKTINLLEWLSQEQIIPRAIFDLYKTIEGKSVSTKNELKQVKEFFPDKQIKVTVPYYTEQLQPTSSYVTVSLGGAHGSWSKAPIHVEFMRPLKQVALSDQMVNSQTVDFKNVFSIDADSFYPTLSTQLNIFGPRYAETVARRLELKHALPHDETTWADEDRQRAQQANVDKLLINSLTGKANTHNPNAALALDNKITSMRIIGNLLIYELATRFTRWHDGKVLLTNTDGIKVAFEDSEITESDVKAFADRIGKPYGINYEVKRRDRVMLKDSNNVLEWSQGKLVNVTGKLGKGYQGRLPLSGSIDHPVIVDMAVTAWFSQAKVTNPTEFMQSYLTKRLKGPAFQPLQWCLIVRPTEKSRVLVGQQEVKNVTRVILTKQGKQISLVSATGKNRTLPGWPTTTIAEVPDVRRLPSADSFDVSAYLTWATNVLRTWGISAPDPDQTALDFNAGGKSEVVSLLNMAAEPAKPVKPKYQPKDKNGLFAQLMKEYGGM